jgi:competence protein ComEC
VTPPSPAIRWPWAVLAWGLGLAAQLQQSALWSAWAYALTVVLGAWLWWAHHGQVPRVLRCLGLALTAWGITGLQACAMPQAIDPELEGRDLDVVGLVLAMAQRQDSGWRFRMVVEEARLDGRVVQVPRQLYVGWYSASARDEQDLVPQQVWPGERWRLRLRLKAAHGHLNPRGFDYELWLWEQGIRATGYVRQGAHDPPPQRLAQTAQHPLEWARQSVRERLLDGRFPDAVAGVLAALVVGDQAAIDRSSWDVFRVTGVAHLMSISGLHVTLLGALAGRVLGALWRRSAAWGWMWAMHWPAPFVAAWGGWMVACGYALFSGWGVPAQRTVWMLGVVTFLRWRARHWPPALVWSGAGVVVLTLDPWALLQAGFWLSFVAVGVLMLTGAQPEQSQGGRRIWLSRIGGLLREQWVISLALAPLSLLFFGQISLSGLLANLVAIPWVSAVVTPLALLGMLWSPAWTGAAALLAPLMEGLAWLANWPLASLRLAMPPWPLALLATAGAALCCLPWPKAWRVWGALGLLPALLWQAPRPPLGVFELLAADVGQGNAVLLRTAHHTLLYDTGPRYSPESDAGHRVLVPLLAQSDERLDVLMLSHRDSDHTGGAAAVLAMQPQVRLWSSLEASHPLAQRPGHVRCALGQRWEWDGVQLEVLHPLPDARTSKPNALSCVLRVQGKGGSALLAGDIEAPQERDLLARGLAPVDVLLVPHHGSKTSSSEAFLDALQPSLALVQAGYRNRFGHPAPAVAQRYQDRGVRWVLSAHCGAAIWRSDQAGQVHCERQAAPRYWRHVPYRPGQ